MNADYVVVREIRFWMEPYITVKASDLVVFGVSLWSFLVLQLDLC